MTLTIKTKSIIFGCLLGLLPVIKLWLEYPVTLTSLKQNAVVKNINVKVKNEIFTTVEGAIAINCYYFDITFKILPDGSILSGTNELQTCDKSAVVEKIKYLKNKQVSGYLTKNQDQFIPTGLLTINSLFKTFLMTIGAFLFCLLCGYFAKKKESI